MFECTYDDGDEAVVSTCARRDFNGNEICTLIGIIGYFLSPPFN